MDPAFVSKLLDEDEVDNIHSGADVEAFTAALNRDISVDIAPSTILQRANPPVALGASTTDSNSTPSQLIEDWHASNERDHAANRNLYQEQQKDIDSQVKHEEHGEYQQKQPDHQTELSNKAVQLGNRPSSDTQHLQKDLPFEKVQDPNSQESSAQWQQDKQPASASDSSGSLMKRVKPGSVPFNVLIPILRPNLDKDRNMQLDAVFAKLRSNEITKENFLKVIRSIVGDTMLRQAAKTVQDQMNTSAKTGIDSHPPLLGLSSNTVKQERDVSVMSAQAVTKQQQPMYGPRPLAASSLVARKTQVQDLQMRQMTPQGLLPIHSSSNHEVQTGVSEFSRHGGHVSHVMSQFHSQHNQSQLSQQLSAGKEQRTFSEQTEQESRHQFPTLQGTMFNATQNSFKTDATEKQTSRVTFSGSANMVVPNQMPGSVTSNTQLSGPGTRTPKKTSIGLKKPLEVQGTSPSPASKKQKTSGAYHDQSIEQLNDVTAVSGVNLREEEEQLLSAPKEESRGSEATRKVVREEEEKLILHKGPLHKRIAQIMAKCGVKNISSDVERCLSLSVEERLRGLISNVIRISRHRVDLEKARHQIVVTSDVRRHILMMSRKAKDEWERKQAEEAERLRKQNEGDGNGGSDGDKDKDEAARSKSIKSKEEDDKMRTTAANVAARAAVGGDDMLSKWQLMAEQARQKREGISTSGTSSVDAPKISLTKTSKEHHDGSKKASSVSSSGGMRKFGRIVAQPKVLRSLSARDVIAALEREPQMNKSSLIYKLYHGTPVNLSSN